MKKQILTKQDIQRDLLALLNKRKVVTAWLTFCLNISIFFYIVYAVLYASGVYLPPRHLSFVSPTAVMIIVPFVILFFAGFLFFYYIRQGDDLFVIVGFNFNQFICCCNSRVDRLY